MLGGNVFTITPKGYTFSGDNIFDYRCTVAVSYMSDNSGLYILGDTFLRNFVSTYNFAEEKI